MIDKEMYSHMSCSKQSVVVDRGLALHKMMRLTTLGLGGEGYLSLWATSSDMRSGSTSQLHRMVGVPSIVAGALTSATTPV